MGISARSSPSGLKSPLGAASFGQPISSLVESEDH